MLKDPEIHDLLKRLPRRYAGELKALLEFPVSTDLQSVIRLRHQLAG